ncbi:unnamed protein product [Rotaria sp. Silwood1]|nr:unnamed protein product [Rotaria sp. Silwood1]
MNNIEQTCFTINTRPLIIDETFILIKKTTKPELDLSTLSPVYRTIHHSNGDFYSITCNVRYLLIHQHPNLCLVDGEMKIAKQTLWSYGAIHDMCWSSTLDRFIVLGKKNIFLINENTMSIDNAYAIQEQEWLSCTCSDTILFTSTNEWGSSITEFTLFPTIEMIKTSKYPLICMKDEVIADMAYNNGNLALMVMNASKKSLRMELRYAKTLDRIWILDQSEVNVFYKQELPIA